MTLKMSKFEIFLSTDDTGMPSWYIRAPSRHYREGTVSIFVSVGKQKIVDILALSIPKRPTPHWLLWISNSSIKERIKYGLWIYSLQIRLVVNCTCKLCVVSSSWPLLGGHKFFQWRKKREESSFWEERGGTKRGQGRRKVWKFKSLVVIWCA